MIGTQGSGPRVIGPRAVRGFLAAFATVFALGSQCDPKEEDFFEILSGPLQEDTFAPVFSNPLPTCANPVISTDNFMVNVADANGALPSSGLDLDSFRAFQIGGDDLPHQASQANGTTMLTIDVSGIPDGNAKVGVTGSDMAGNEGTFTWDKILDRMPPVLSFLMMPPDRTTTDLPEVVLTFEYSAEDENFDSGEFLLRTTSQAGMCVESALRTVPPEILMLTDWEIGTGVDRWDVPFTNPVPEGGDPLAIDFCAILSATDRAVDKEGREGVNSSTTAVPFTIEFRGADPTTGAVEGVVTVDGAGAAGIQVTAGGMTATTDAEGFYRIAGLPPGPTTVQIAPPEDVHCETTARMVDIAVGETRTADFACVSRGDLTGTVTVDGEPEPGAQVRITGPQTLTVTTDGEGRFSAPNLIPGSYQVTALIDGVVCPSVSAQVQSGQTTDVTVPCTTPVGFDVDVAGGYRHIQPGLSEICGKVTTDPAQPGASFTATITGPGVIPPGTVTANLDDMGMATFALPINQPGTYTIEVSVTSGGTTETATTTVVVQPPPTQGTCPG